MKSFCTRGVVLAVIILSLLLSSAQLAHGQTDTQGKPAPQNKTNSLGQMVEEARIAQSTRDLPQVKAANRKVIVAAMRELVHVRLLQAAYPQAVELQKHILAIEDSPESRTELAVCHYMAGEWDDAIREAMDVVRVSPKNVRAWDVIGRGWMAKGDYSKAGDAFSQSVKLEPDFATSYALATSLLMTKDDSNKLRATRIFGEMQKERGESGELHVLFGRAYRDAEDYPNALKEFRRAIALNPKTPHAHYLVAATKLATADADARTVAREELQKELALYPKDYLANYMLGILEANNRAFAVSDQHLQVASKIDSTQPDPWLYLGLNANRRGEDRAAQEYLKKAIAATGKEEQRGFYQIRRAYVVLSRLAAKDGNAEESKRLAEHARILQEKLFEENQSAFRRVRDQSAMGEDIVVTPDASVERSQLQTDVTDPFERVSDSAQARHRLTDDQLRELQLQEDRLRPILATSCNDLATAEFLSGDYAAALAHYQEAEKWDSTAPGLMRNLGLSAYHAGNTNEAIRGFAAVLAANSSDAAIRSALGSLYFANQEYANAAETFAPLGEEGTHNARLAYAWGTSLVRMGKISEGEKLLQAAVTAKPDHAEAQFELGKVLQTQGEAKQALPHLETAAKLLSGTIEAQQALFDCYKSMGRTDDADRIQKTIEQLKARTGSQ